jgi:hypothetical protein
MAQPEGHAAEERAAADKVLDGMAARVAVLTRK